MGEFRKGWAVNCSKCGAGVETTDHFCSRCGALAIAPAVKETICKSCGAGIEAPANFCDRCGEPTSLIAEGKLSGEGSVHVVRSRCDVLHGHESLGRPSYAPTILVTLFFGLFGLIPAILHSRQAQDRGYPTSGYWWSFGLAIVGSIVSWWILAFIFFTIESALLSRSVNTGIVSVQQMMNQSSF